MPFVISAGQSNNDYYATEPPVARKIQTANKPVQGGPDWNPLKVRAWNSRTLLPNDSDTVTDYGTAWVKPHEGDRPYNVTPTGNGSGVWLCYNAALEDPFQRPWYHLHSSRGSHAIATWWNGGVQKCLQRLNVIENNALTPGQPALIFDWQGNESDCYAGTDLATYKAAHHAIVANQRARGALAENALILITGIHPHVFEDTPDPAPFNAMLAELAAEYDVAPSRGVFVPVVGNLSPGSVHWDALTQTVMGREKWLAAKVKLGL